RRIRNAPPAVALHGRRHAHGRGGCTGVWLFDRPGADGSFHSLFQLDGGRRCHRHRRQARLETRLSPPRHSHRLKSSPVFIFLRKAMTSISYRSPLFNGRRQVLHWALGIAAAALSPTMATAQAWQQVDAIRSSVGDASVSTSALQLTLPLV